MNRGEEGGVVDKSCSGVDVGGVTWSPFLPVDIRRGAFGVTMSVNRRVNETFLCEAGIYNTGDDGMEDEDD
jgi:hypothetical protein